MAEGAQHARATGGGVPRVPSILGQYEVGRSGKPWYDIRPSAAFLDNMIKGLVTELSGDPGSYEPNAYAQFGQHAMRKVPRSFDSTDPRDMKLTYGNTDSPGAVYDVTDRKSTHRLDPKVESISVANFRSRSDQRPSSKSYVPGAGTYSPNMQAIYGKTFIAGASFRSKSGRMHKERSMTDSHLGPGAYSVYDGSLYADSQRSTPRSKRAPGFGSTLPQRPILNAAGAPSFSAQPRESPGPGAYEAFEPRIKDALRLGVKNARFRGPGMHSYHGPNRRPQSARAAIRV